MDKKSLLLIPVFNESETIKAVLENVKKYYAGDILLVDDGSTDRSIEVLGCVQCQNIKVIYHEENMGYGQSLIDGFNYAIKQKYDVVITMDCDAQHEPEFIPNFIRDIDDVDMVSGSRYLQNSQIKQHAPEDRKNINTIITEIVNAKTQYRITDAFCGFKSYKVSCLSTLKLSETGYGFPLQFWIQAANNNIRIKEIPVTRIYTHLDRSFGEEMDNPDTRLAYYKGVIKKELQKWT